MNNKINELKMLVTKETEKSNKEVTILEAKLQLEYNKIFAKDKMLKKSIKALDRSKEYGSDDNGIHCWIRCDLSRYKDAVQYLETYLEDIGLIINIDIENNALIQYLGPQIVINTDGDILDEYSMKWIIESDQYTSITQRNKLIREYMKQNGYFPGVFQYTDNYGSIKLVRI